ncbi:FMRFamide receptor-like [Tubulanus polymorphus]|uniref:FMRFamide receptor-like n=1 Tax=Tubulanus polymorphus TaxID=672921 RepID=UPI003DA53950
MLNSIDLHGFESYYYCKSNWAFKSLELHHLKKLYASLAMNVTTTLKSCDELRPPVKWDYQLSVYLYIFVYGPLTVVGIFLNIISLFVFHRLQNSIYFTIQILAVYDTLFISCAFLMYPFRIIYLYIVLGDLILRFDDWHFGWEIILPVLPLFYSFQTLRNWTVVVVSIERLIVVSFPLKHMVFWRRKTKICLSLFLALTFVVLHWSYFFPKNIPIQWNWPCLKRGQYAFTIWLNPKRYIVFVYDYTLVHRISYFLYLIGTILAPFMILMISNILLVFFVWRAKRLRAKLISTDSQNKQEQILLKMVLSIVAVYIFLEFPASIDRFRAIVPFMNERIAMAIRKIGYVLTMGDSSVNFLIYCATNDSFKLVARQMFLKLYRNILMTKSNSENELVSGH